MNLNKSNIKDIFYILPSFIFITVFFFYPIGYIFGISFLEWNGISQNKSFIGLDNYKNFFTDPIAMKSLGNQILWGIITILSQMFLGLTMAILLRSQAKFKIFYKLIFFLPNIISVAVVAYVFNKIYDNNFGELNYFLDSIKLNFLQHPWLGDPDTALYCLMIANIWQWTGFSFLLYHAGMTQINEELYESARIDGANIFNIVRNIVIPLLKPTHIALLILGVIGTLKTFDIIYLTTRGGPARSTEFLSTYIFQKGILEFKASYASTMALMIVLIALVITVLQVKVYNRRG
ncbi:MAG: sugar ABC transporter permease [SAR202 cluster bacterium]|jgi:raffinose/stachyose/melibiose transport system permease protein|nr:sugar ABC transporter permease [SAR202 cluster bacterium]|tara:strand:- start:580 stop:1452 length:873 start_codon:yes stop_codon:yes gene_type:complete